MFTSVRWSPDGSVIAVGAKSDRVYLLSLADGSSLRTPIYTLGEVVDLSWSPKGQALAVAGMVSIQVHALSSAGSKTFRLGEEITANEWRPDDSSIAVGHRGGKVRLISPRTGIALSSDFDTPGSKGWGFGDLSWGTSGRRLLVVAEGRATILRVDPV
jgi:WD40 repeat protein